MTEIEYLDTPRLLIHADIMKSNLIRMSNMCHENGVALRPHTKTHKSPEIARLQMDHGAIGVAVGRVWEAEMMARAGIRDILIANVVMGSDQLCRVAQIALTIKMTTVVDSSESVRALSNAAKARGSSIAVVIEVDTGSNRLGVKDEGELWLVLGAVLEAPNLQFEGLLNYPGHVSHSPAETFCTRARENASRFLQFRNSIECRGVEVRTMSGGCTSTVGQDLSVGGMTEVRPGTYVLNDLRRVVTGCATLEDCAATIHSRVISRRASKAVLDVGQRLLANDCVEMSSMGVSNGRELAIGLIRDMPGAFVEKVWDEQSRVDFSCAEGVLMPGDTVEVIPAHICPSMESFRKGVLVEKGKVLRSFDLSPSRVTEGY